MSITFRAKCGDESSFSLLETQSVGVELQIWKIQVSAYVFSWYI